MLNWLKKAGIRAMRTIAQAAAAVLGTSAVLSEVDWKMVISAAAAAGILSLLTSITGIPEIGQGKNCCESECLYDETEDAAADEIGETA